MTPRILDAEEPGDILLAARLLIAGGIVAVPTETVYGLGADAANDDAVRRVFDIKERPPSHPLILHVAGPESACAASGDWTPMAEILARRFWPGPLSILIERSGVVSDVVTGSRSTVVVRVPNHPATLELLREMHRLGSPGLAAPSANKFGAVSPTTARHVVDDLGDLVDAVLDGGPCSVGVESTIVDCRRSSATILREGGVPREDISAELGAHGFTLSGSSSPTAPSTDTSAIAPGMLVSHYAPRARVEVFEDEQDLERRSLELTTRGVPHSRLPHPDDVALYSRNLYASLRSCDSTGAQVILALLPIPHGLGAAVRDRLRKAAAAR